LACAGERAQLSNENSPKALRERRKERRKEGSKEGRKEGI
jgi:hypothetical protein